jgi:hypothetical protein
MGRSIAIVGLVIAGSLVYLATAWLVVMATDACWWPWHDILPGEAQLCSIGM